MMIRTLRNFWEAIIGFLTRPIYESETAHLTVGTLMSIVVVIVAINVLLKIIKKVINSRLAEEDKNKFVSIFGFARYLFYILAIITILHASGLNLTVFLTASAALFVGLGFALQYLFQDIISGILIIMDQSLHVGDVVEIQGKVGKVTEINLRTTRAVTRDDKVLVIPNHKFLVETIYNHTQNHNTTLEKVTVGVDYGSDVQLVTQLLLEIVCSQKGIQKKQKPVVLFDDFGESALIFSVVYTTGDSFTDNRIKSELRYRIHEAFQKNNIVIPFPQRTLHWTQPNQLTTDA
jgi:small-conductance mechanosensitive channel